MEGPTTPRPYPTLSLGTNYLTIMESSCTAGSRSWVGRAWDQALHAQAWPVAFASLYIGSQLALAPSGHAGYEVARPVAVHPAPTLEVLSTVSVAEAAVTQSAHTTGRVVPLWGTAFGVGVSSTRRL
jgi:hypothetical protein